MTSSFPTPAGATRSEVEPRWPAAPSAPPGTPNVLVVLLDDVGFADFGCYGSAISTPAIDGLAANGLAYTGFHTTAMCSTTRAALLTGRNHHSVGMGCLANFDSGYPGYRGKIAPEAGTLAEMLAPHGIRSYMVGKWHATRTTEIGPTGPFDGWPLGRGFDRFYGFMDAETDQYAPELVRDNTHITPPGTYETGYHLTEDLADQAISFLADHRAALPDEPWLLWFAPGACHAPHQVGQEFIDRYDDALAHGWDVEREQRLARQIALGIVPEGTGLPPRNPSVEAWADHSEAEQRVFRRLAAAYAGMLDHTDRQIARVIRHLERTGQLDDTLVLVMSDNGASQEGGPLGFVNAMGPFNLMHESMDDKIARIDDIGGPGTHTNFPWGWAMASNTPLRRYKQNTHGGGVRDPLVISWPAGIAARGELRHQFCHASDVVPTVLEALGIEVGGEAGTGGAAGAAMPIEGVSFAATFADADATTAKEAQYFEMFGHRGIWVDGWKAVTYHRPGTPFADDVWELFDLSTDFNEIDDRAEHEPDRLRSMVERWWREAEANQVLPLDDRFAERFAENAQRFHGDRTRYEFWSGMGHVPSDVAPDVRSRSYSITAEVTSVADGVLIAHGDATCGYSLYVQDGHLVHDLNVGGTHQLLRSPEPIDPAAQRLRFAMDRREGHGAASLSIDGVEVARMETDAIFWLLISWSGLDLGLDRGSPVSDYVAPFAYGGDLTRVVIEMGPQNLDHEAAGTTELARE